MPEITTSDVLISLGSNINPEANLQAAIDALREISRIVAVSSVYQTPPFGYTEQPDFLDIAVRLQTDLEPADFKASLDAIETQLGRDRTNQKTPYGPLPLDIDILMWGEEAFGFGSKPWYVPHTSVTEEAAVIIPLAEIAPEMIHPGEHISLREIAARFITQDVVIRYDLTIQ